MNVRRLATIAYPTPFGSPGRTVTLTCGVAAGDVDSRLNRITHISSTGMTGPLSTYAHCGLSRRVLTALGCGLAVSLSGAAAPAQGGYPALDRFGRLLDLHHLYASGAFAGQTAQRFEYAYDLAGNRVQARLTQRPTADPNWPGGWRPHANDRSYEYGYDALQRLIFAGHGQLDAAGQLVMTGSPWRTLDWSLDLLGNWSDPNAPPGQRQGLTVTTGDGVGPESESWVNHVAAQDNRLESVVTSAGAGLATQQHVVTDAAGNLTYDGQYFYQYDGLNRLVQVNQATTWGANGDCGTGVPPELCDPNLFAAAFTSDPADIARFQHRPGAWIARYAYDGLGRLICKTTPVTPGAADPGQRREHYYYDGVRRIREMIEREPDVVVLLTGGDPNNAGDPNLWGDPNVGGWAGTGSPPDPNDLPPGDPNDPEYAAAATAAAGVEEPAEIVPLDPLPALVISAYPANWSHRDYVWGPEYVDELVAVFDRAGKCWYALSDGNFNVVALARGNHVDSSKPLGQVVEQRVYEPYGALLNHDILSPDAPVVPVGHQGLFFDRFDGVQTDRAIAPTARGVYQNRNRVYRPREGRFNQRDVNQTAAPILMAMASQAASIDALLGGFDLRSHYGDGANLWTFTGSNPVNRTDPLGLMSFGDLLAGGGYYTTYAYVAVTNSAAAMRIVGGALAMANAYNAYLLATDPEYLHMLTSMPGGLGFAQASLNALLNDARAMLRAAGGALEVGAMTSLARTSTGLTAKVHDLIATERVNISSARYKAVRDAIAADGFIRESIKVVRTPSGSLYRRWPPPRTRRTRTRDRRRPHRGSEPSVWGLPDVSGSLRASLASIEMALWQYDLVILTTSRESDASPVRTSASVLQSRLEHLARALDDTLQRKPSWSKQVTIWGTHQAHQVEVYSDSNGKIVEAIVRIDVRQPYDRFLHALMTIVSQVTPACVGPGGNHLRPCVEDISADIDKSSAMLYVRDPHRYFQVQELFHDSRGDDDR